MPLESSMMSSLAPASLTTTTSLLPILHLRKQRDFQSSSLVDCEVLEMALFLFILDLFNTFDKEKQQLVCLFLLLMNFGMWSELGNSTNMRWEETHHNSLFSAQANCQSANKRPSLLYMT